MLRTLVRSALIAALITGGSFFAAQAPASARTDNTGCNANNPGRGCPGNLRRLGSTGSPVCGRGRHVGNPHCRPAAGGTTTDPPNVRSSGTRVRSSVTRARSVATRTTPRANRAVAPRVNKAVSTRAAKAL